MMDEIDRIYQDILKHGVPPEKSLRLFLLELGLTPYVFDEERGAANLQEHLDFHVMHAGLRYHGKVEMLTRNPQEFTYDNPELITESKQRIRILSAKYAEASFHLQLQVVPQLGEDFEVWMTLDEARAYIGKPFVPWYTRVKEFFSRR